jgi:hypothetical protein
VADRFPDYDVLAKRGGPSWNALTRRVIDERLALTIDDDVLGPARTATLCAIVARIVPQPAERAPVNAAAILIAKIARDDGDGYRPEGLPHLREAWTIGLDAIEAEARDRQRCAFAVLGDREADALLRRVEAGTLGHPARSSLPSRLFWQWRLLPDIVSAYYAHPSAWSAMGFGGPAAPRGYVRMEADRRDGWEAAERHDGRLIGAAFRNRHVR